jgi:hypothetical protein
MSAALGTLFSYISAIKLLLLEEIGLRHYRSENLCVSECACVTSPFGFWWIIIMVVLFDTALSRFKQNGQYTKMFDVE